jgi:hypothetical protein
MNNDRKNIDRLFEEKLKGFKEATPIYAWDKLDQQLQKNKAGKAFVLYRWIAASVIILLAFGAGFLVATYQNDRPDYAKNNETPGIENIDQDNQAIPKKEILPNKTKKEVLVQENAEFINNPIIKKAGRKADTNFLITESSQIYDPSVSGHYPKKLNKMSHQEVYAINIVPDHHLINLSNKYTYMDFSYKYETDTYIIDEPTFDVEDTYFDQPNNSIHKSKWVIGAQFAPVSSYRDISTTYSNPGTEDENYLNNVEENTLSMAGGIDVGYDINEKWNIQSGLYYSQIGQINNDPLTYKHENDQYVLITISTSAGDLVINQQNIPQSINQIPDTKDTIDVINSLNVRVVQNFDLFEIPLIFRYKLLNKRFSVNLAGGLSPAIVVNDKTYLEADSKQYDVGSPDNLNPFIINSSIAMGLEYAVSNRFSLNFEPTLKYALSPLNKDSKFNYHPYSISWFTGLRYRF